MKLFPVIGFSAALSFGTLAFAANKLTETVTRTPTSPSSVSFQLSEDIYHTWYTDDPYYVDIPYEEDETYWERVPYDTQEWVCDRMHGLRAAGLVLARGRGDRDDDHGGGWGRPPREEPRPEPPREEPRPDPQPEPPREEPRPEPPREEPRPEPPREPQCRWETRTEYRDEQRTRRVTKYRQEERCCQRNEHTSFDHTWKQPVQVNFPRETALLPGESEKVTFSLAGSEGRPELGVDSSRAIFRYKVARSDVTGGKLVVDLEFTPHLGMNEAGPTSIGNMVLVPNAQGATLSVQDKITSPRVKTSFSAKLLLKPEGTVLAETAEFAKGADGLWKAKFAGTFDPNKDYAVQLHVEREGIVLTEKLVFDLPRDFPAEKVDMAKLADKAQIDKFSWPGEGAESAIRFVDLTPVYKTVKTAYTVKISTVAGKQLILGTVERAGLKKDNYGRLLLPVKALGAPAPVLRQLTHGTKFKVEFTATRTSTRFAPIAVRKSGEMIVGR